MPQIKDIIDVNQAPLTQWEPAIGDAPSVGKAYEDALIYPAIEYFINENAAKFVTGIIADEARLESYLAAEVPGLEKVYHLTLTGAFEAAARKNAEGQEKVEVVVNAEDIPSHSQDVVVMNMILGCVAMPGQYQNITNMLNLVGSLLKEDGKLVIVRPNPAGGDFCTYKTLTPANDLKGGEEYAFTVAGLQEYGAMKNLYTPDDFMKAFTTAAGFSMEETLSLCDAKLNEKPFLLNVCKIKPGMKF